MFINATRRYGKPEFGIDTVELNGKTLDVVEAVPFALPFCDLLHMSKPDAPADQTPVLIVAPMSGHYATLLRGTVRQMLPDHDVYVTDWVDARDVPLSEGRFDLDDYTDYVMEQCRYIARSRVSVLPFWPYANPVFRFWSRPPLWRRMATPRARPRSR